MVIVKLTYGRVIINDSTKHYSVLSLRFSDWFYDFIPLLAAVAVLRPIGEQASVVLCTEQSHRGIGWCRSWIILVSGTYAGFLTLRTRGNAT